MQQAKHMAATFTADPQMRLPHRPRMSEDLVRLWPNRQTMVALGGLGEIVLRGKSVGTLLPTLLPLLSGRWSVPEIVERVPGVRPGAVEDALFLLYTQGLLEDAQVSATHLTPALVRAFDSQLKFYSRYVDHTRAARSRYEVLDRLQSCTVTLLGDGGAARRVLDDLLALGLGRARLVALDGADPAWLALEAPHAQIERLAAGADGALPPEVAAESDLLLLVSDRPRPALTRALNRLALERGLTFLRALLGAAAVEIGPALFPGQSSCYECAHLLNLIDLDASEPDLPAPGAQDALTPEQQIGASQTALAVLSILTRFLPIKTGNTLHRLSLDTLELVPHAVYSLPGCPACSRVRGYTQGRSLRVSPTHRENWPALYHANTNERSYSLFPKGHQVHYAPKNTKTLAGSYKTYANRPAIPLPGDGVSLPERLGQPFAALAYGARPLPRSGPARLEDMALLLQLAAGRQSYGAQSGWQIGFRITPSAGALASQTLYLVSFTVEGLAPGLYHFNPHGALEQLRQADLRQQLDRAVPGAEDLPPEGVAAAIIQTSAFGRIESKYQAKSYRYALYDGGVMLHSLQVISGLLGFELWQTSSFYDDEVCAILDLHTPTEFPLLVTYLVADAHNGWQPTRSVEDTGDAQESAV